MAQAAPNRVDGLMDGPGGPPKIKPGISASRRKLAEDSGEKVTVGCKLPSGLTLQLYEMITVPTQVLGGGIREVEQARALPGEIIRLNGCRAPWGEHPGHEIKHGVGITFGVPKTFWEEWCRQNLDSPLLLSGTIFAQSDRKSLVDQAKDERERRSGLEPISPDKDPRIPKNRYGQPAVTSKDDKDE